LGVGDLQARYNPHSRLQARNSSHSLFFNNIIYYFIFIFIHICFYLSNLQLCPAEGVLPVGQEHLSGALPEEAASEALLEDNATPRVGLPGVKATPRVGLPGVKATLRV